MNKVIIIIIIIMTESKIIISKNKIKKHIYNNAKWWIIQGKNHNEPFVYKKNHLRQGIDYFVVWANKELVLIAQCK